PQERRPHGSSGGRGVPSSLPQRPSRGRCACDNAGSMMRRSVSFVATLFASALLAASPLKADPSRIAVVRPLQPHTMMSEAIPRLSAGLVAAGFEVILVDAAPSRDPRAQVEEAGGPSSPRATIALVPVEASASADVWIADHTSHRTLVSRIDLDAAS